MRDIDQLRELFEEAADAAPEVRAGILARVGARDPASADALRRMLEEDGASETPPPVEARDVRRAAHDPLAATIPHPDGVPSGAPRAPDRGPGRPNDRRADAIRSPQPLMAPESSRAQLDMPVDSPTVDGVQLEGMVGSGGLGRVYRGIDGRRVVAVKVPRPDRLDRTLLLRWEEECALAHELPSHPNIVTVHQITTARFRDGTIAPAMVMEYLPGAADLLEYARRNRLDRDARMSLFAQACRGVSHLHGRAVVHGDIKPSNLLVIDTAEGPLLKVGDLGGTRTILRHDTRPPQFTWIYASPEQIDDDPVKIGPQSDVYSLGKVLCALVCGIDAVRLPPMVDRRGYAEWTAPGLTDRLGLRDAHLEHVIRRATARTPSDRFDDADEFCAEVRRCPTPRLQRALLHVGDWLNRPLSPRQRSDQFVRRGAVVAVAAALAFAATILLCNWHVRRDAPLQFVIGATAPDRFEHVAVVRLRDLDELREVTERFGIDGVDPERVRTIRRLWAAVIRRLADAEARVIAMDIAFPQAPEPELDAVILDAVRDARRSGSAVVVAVQAPEVDLGPHRIAPALRDEVDLIGDMRVLPSLAGLGSVAIVIDRPDTAPRLPLAIAAAAATQAEYGRRDRLQVQVDPANSRIAVRGVRAPGISIEIMRFEEYDPDSPDHGHQLFPQGVDPGERLGFFVFEVPDDALLESIEIAVADVLDPAGTQALRERVRGRVVIVANGALPASPDVHTYIPAMRRPGGESRTVPGPWFHAAAIESILSGVPGPRVSSDALSLSAIGAALAVTGGWWVGAIHARRRSPHRAPRAATNLTAVASAVWLAAIAAIPIGLVVIGAAVAVTFQYSLAVGILSLLFGASLGVGLGLRAAWSRRAQVASLREVTHAW